MKEIVSRNGSLRAGFFRDVRKVSRARKIISAKEREILCTILEDGVEDGSFHITDIKRRSVVIIHAIQGLDVSYIRDNLIEYGVDKTVMVNYVCDLILKGIINR
jgi:hypothetical protein